MKNLFPKEAQALLESAHREKHVFSRTPLREILDVLDRVGKLWTRQGSYFERALQALEDEISFSPQMLEHSLDLLPSLCSRKNLEARLLAEFHDLEILDRFLERDHFEGRVRFIPHGVLLHVSAGNVFLGAIDSLLLGLLAKNFNIVKLSHANQVFPKLFAESLAEADPQKKVAPFARFVSFKGGDSQIESIFHQGVDAVIAWGGDEMVRSYRKNLPPGIPLIEHGPKISVQVIFKQATEFQSLDELGRAVAHDILMWDQAACASPQNCFVENGIEASHLLDAVARHLQKPEFPRGSIDANESVEIHKEAHRAKASAALEQGHFRQGETWLLHWDPRPGIRPSPLNRTLIFKPFSDLENLKWQLSAAKGALQSCSYLATGTDRTQLLDELSLLGMQRFAKLGTIMEGLTGAPHDGHYAITELGRFVPDETRTDVLEFVNERVKNIEFYRKLYGQKKIRSLSDLIPLEKLDIPLPAKLEGGQIFSSGGTTGKPKYVFFSNSEFRKTASLLAKGYLAQGLRPGDLCANLFVAGNLWSSFLAVEKALIECQAVQLPIGGLAEPTLILEYLERFKPRAVFGLPSLLSQLASQTQTPLDIPFVFYAGEHLTLPAREQLSKIWNSKHIYSAGYASVDAGPIGYQCPHLQPREHHIFEDSVHLEIQNGEGIVTSLIRRTIPIIHLRTGDHLEWTSSPHEPCPCGSRERRFLLHGRVDGQIRVFSSRVLLEEIEKGITKASVGAGLFQVTIEDDPLLQETLTIVLELDKALTSTQIQALQVAVFDHCKDLKATHSFNYLQDRLRFKTGQLPRLPRTGKVRPVVDLRKI